MGGVFISYRRDDSAGYAGRLYDALTAHFGKDLVFIDIDSIHAGQDFANVIEQQIGSCAVVIVLIGKAWLNSIDDRGGRRLDDPHDFVRLEVASAIRQKKPVIPVLVGAARMPRVEDLPAPLAPLAHFNAIEIFDQLFRDSVRHLVKEIRPLVRPKPVLWRWTGWFENRLRVGIGAVVLMATLGVAGLIFSVKRTPDHNDSRETAPLPSEMLVVPDDSGSPASPVKITTPPDVAELPSIVEASRNVMLPGSSSQVTGPAKPRILWRAKVTVGDAWHVLGIAADGTVYLYDQERNVLDAIRDGKEQWAYNAPGPAEFGPADFTPDGRVWTGNYCFNSRGEGGRITNKNLLRNRAILRPGAAQHQETYACSEGKVYAMDGRGKKTWAIDLDGNCGSQSPTVAPQSENIYASSDAHTLYAISREGRLLWTVKQACRKSDVKVHPLRNGELVVACRDQPLYSLRDGKPLWTSNLDASDGWYWSEPMFDGSGNIFVGGEGPSSTTELTALDKSGKQAWNVSAGTISMPEPIGFDAQGRLYVSVSGQIVSLSQ